MIDRLAALIELALLLAILAGIGIIGYSLHCSDPSAFDVPLMKVAEHLNHARNE